MDNLEEIARRIEALRKYESAFLGIGYRHCTPRYANSQGLLTGEGSGTHGGRWNPIGIKAVYASLSPETALAEALSHFKYYRLNIADAMPRVFIAARVNLRGVLDLTDGIVRQRLRISLQRMMEEDWRKLQHAGEQAVTQMIGQAAFEAGMEGLLAPSFADPGGTNMICFPANLTRSSRLTILNPVRLRK